jgi:hypothetical protein
MQRRFAADTLLSRAYRIQPIDNASCIIRSTGKTGAGTEYRHRRRVDREDKRRVCNPTRESGRGSGGDSVIKHRAS